ncbi:hypothetical protein [Nocardia sp. NPDC050413]|uniref:hypothetical protein n=1 Tax=Nocardia sp. NPDC050413 TaxID=3155784 RepID=UPI00340077D0
MTISTFPAGANSEPPRNRPNADPRVVLALAVTLAGVCGVAGDWATATLVLSQVLALFTLPAARR